MFSFSFFLRAAIRRRHCRVGFEVFISDGCSTSQNPAGHSCVSASLACLPANYITSVLYSSSLLGLAVGFTLFHFLPPLFCVRLAVQAERGHYELAKEPADAPAGVGHAQRGALLRQESRHVRKQTTPNKRHLQHDNSLLVVS